MKRNTFALLTALVLLFSLPMSVWASDAPPPVVDNAGLFTPQEAEILTEMALELRQNYEMDIVILTVDSLEGASPRDFADDYYDQNGYGCGPAYSGALFLISMEYRDWYISTSGDAMACDLVASGEEALPWFGTEDYFGGFHAWLSVLPGYFEAGEDAASDYGQTYPEDTVYVIHPSLLMSLGIGLAVAAAVIGIMCFGMNTRRPRRSAADYLTDGSYHLRTCQDLFLYSSISKRPRPRENSGGSRSSHRSSSGRSHGGGGGKF